MGYPCVRHYILFYIHGHLNNSPVVFDGYVKYEEAEVDRLVAILKTNNCGGGGGPCGIQ